MLACTLVKFLPYTLKDVKIILPTNSSGNSQESQKQNNENTFDLKVKQCLHDHTLQTFPLEMSSSRLNLRTQKQILRHVTIFKGLFSAELTSPTKERAGRELRILPNRDIQQAVRYFFLCLKKNKLEHWTGSEANRENK